MNDRKSNNKSSLRRSGGSLIEMVFAFTVLLWLSFGMVEFGQFFYIRHAFDAAVRDGARVAILPTATQTQVVNAITKTLSQANVTYNTTWLTMSQSSDGSTYTTVTDCATVPIGYVLSMTLSTNYSSIPNAVRPLSSMTGKGIGTGKLVTAQATMVKD